MGRQLISIISFIVFIGVYPACGWGFWAFTGAGAGYDVQPYEDWDQYGGGVDDCVVVYLDSPDAGDDELGVDEYNGLSEANLTFTEGGNLAGAVGSPPYREFDGLNDYMTMTRELWNAYIAGSSNYCIIMKLAFSGATTGNHMAYFQDAQSGDKIEITCPAGAFNIILDDVDNVAETETLSGGVRPTPDVDEVFYLALWTESGVNSRAGWLAEGAGSGAGGQPTKWSDFPADQRVEWSASFDQMRELDALGGDQNYFMAVAGPANNMPAKVQWFLISPTSLRFND